MVIRRSIWQPEQGSSQLQQYCLSMVQMVTCGHTSGNSPLHIALIGNNAVLQIVRDIIEHGADVNLPNNVGNTPLHVAVQENGIDINIITFLLARRANPLLRNAQHQFVRDLAVREDVKYLVNPYVQIMFIHIKDYAYNNAAKIFNMLAHGIRWVLHRRRAGGPMLTQEAARAFLAEQTNDLLVQDACGIVIDKYLSAAVPVQGQAANSTVQAQQQTAAVAGTVVAADTGCTIL